MPLTERMPVPVCAESSSNKAMPPTIFEEQVPYLCTHTLDHPSPEKQLT